MPRGGADAKLFWVLQLLVGHSFIKVAPNIFSLRPTHHPKLIQTDRPNDLATTAVLAAPRRYRPYVYAWTGLWFLAITVIKLLALNIVTG
jgi:hypothetical protein